MEAISLFVSDYPAGDLDNCGSSEAPGSMVHTVFFSRFFPNKIFCEPGKQKDFSLAVMISSHFKLGWTSGEVNLDTFLRILADLKLLYARLEFPGSTKCHVVAECSQRCEMYLWMPPHGKFPSQ